VKRQILHIKYLPTLLTLVVFWATGLAHAQTGQTPTTMTPASPDITRQQLADFNMFLNDHPELAGQLQKDPSLMDNREFVDNHPSLQEFLERHPEIREEIKENPQAFIRREDRYEQQGDGHGDREITRGELATMDRFLDGHPEIAQQLRKDPSLIDKREFVDNHPELKEFMAQHPELREQFKQHPDAFMHREERFDHDGNRDITRGELATMDRFLDSHPEISEQLQKDPSLIDKREFVDNHPELKEFMAQHPELREQFKQHPDAFMHREERFDHAESDATHRQLATTDRFLDSHPEIAEQVRKDPSLLDNKKFVSAHPALQDYLQQHPEIRQEINENPTAFMREEDRYDHREDRYDHQQDGRDRDPNRSELASFHQFLGDHSMIASQLTKNPELAKNDEYMEGHPELQQYLQAHPGVRAELSQNPQVYMNSAHQFNERGAMPAKEMTPKAPGLDPKPKQ
jgi:hypothetical protein